MTVVSGNFCVLKYETEKGWRRRRYWYKLLIQKLADGPRLQFTYTVFMVVTTYRDLDGTTVFGPYKRYQPIVTFTRNGLNRKLVKRLGFHYQS